MSVEAFVGEIMSILVALQTTIAANLPNETKIKIVF